MSRYIPLLIDHDPSKVIGFIDKDGLGEFSKGVNITRAQLFEILGNAGVKVFHTFCGPNGEEFVRSFEIVEFSSPRGVFPTSHNQESGK